MKIKKCCDEAWKEYCEYCDNVFYSCDEHNKDRICLHCNKKQK